MPRKHGDFPYVRDAILYTASSLFTQKGVHGTSISTAEVDAASAHRAHWVQLAVEWLNDTFDFHLA